MKDRTSAAALHLAAIVEFSDDAIVSKDLQGIITSWNRAAERMFGFTEAEAVGQSITLIVPRERLSDEDHVLGEIRAGRAVDHFETVRRRKDGTRSQHDLTRRRRPVKTNRLRRPRNPKLWILKQSGKKLSNKSASVAP